MIGGGGGGFYGGGSGGTGDTGSDGGGGGGSGFAAPQVTVASTGTNTGNDLIIFTYQQSVVTVVAGSGQSTEAGTSYPQPLVVRVTDPSGAPVLDAPVTFTAAGATFPGSPTTTVAIYGSGLATSPTLTAGGICT